MGPLLPCRALRPAVAAWRDRAGNAEGPLRELRVAGPGDPWTCASAGAARCVPVLRHLHGRLQRARQPLTLGLEAGLSAFEPRPELGSIRRQGRRANRHRVEKAHAHFIGPLKFVPGSRIPCRPRARVRVGPPTDLAIIRSARSGLDLSGSRARPGSPNVPGASRRCRQRAPSRDGPRPWKDSVRMLGRQPRGQPPQQPPPTCPAHAH